MTWHAKNYGGYAASSTEGQDNVSELCAVLYSMGWCDLAVAALLGNGAGESGLNPWRWEGDYLPSFSEFQNWSAEEARHHGYGIFQFTPASKYINATSANRYGYLGYGPNFSNMTGNPDDGAAQCMYFAEHVAGDFLHALYGYYYDDFMGIGVDITPWYYTNYESFINGTDNNGNPLSLNEMVGVFELCYERPGDSYAASSYAYRCNQAAWWLDHLPDDPGPGPDPPGPGPGPMGFPWWILFKFRGRGQIWK